MVIFGYFFPRIKQNKIQNTEQDTDTKYQTELMILKMNL